MLRLTAVFLLALLLLGYGVHAVRVAQAFSDPVGGIRAQDESLYTHCAIRMATQGGWLTPVFLGRFLLYKPPLLAWLSGLSLKAFGISLLALRLPLLLAGALTAALLFAWVRRLRPEAPAAALAAALLLVSNRLWHTFSRISQTDGLVAASIAGALFCLGRDPKLERRSSLLGFGLFTAAAIMSKSVAGLAPLFGLIVYSVIAGRARRPQTRRIVEAALLAAALAAPWHLYQFAAHPRWFWADYVQLQLLGFGVNPPGQVSGESHALFYLKRLFLTDPVLCLLATLALPSLALAVRRREPAGAALLACWLAVSGGLLLVFQYRNLHYVLPLVPALCLLGAGFGPLAGKRRSALLVAGLCAVWAVKAGLPARTWGLPFREEKPLEAARLLRDYCEKRRLNELILLAPDDEFYSATLPLRRVRYLFLDPENRSKNYGPHFAELGITMASAEFTELDRWREKYEERLKSWGLDGGGPLATTIVARNEAEVLDVIRARPRADFYVPSSWRGAVETVAASTHDLAVVSAGRVFLLARETATAPRRALSWPLPEKW